MSLFGNLKEDIMNEVFSDELQAEVVKALNDNIDIPFISEKTEEKALNALYETVEGILKKVIKDKL